MTPREGLPWSWGSTAGERAADSPVTGHVSGRRVVLHRAVDVDAPPSVLWRWLCQLRVAPYSYDLVDNLGRRSPVALTPGADQLAIGQRVMVIFQLVDFAVDDHLTCVLDPRLRALSGEVAVTYRAEPRGGGATSRLTVRCEMGVPNPVRRALATPVAWADLVMMRKQLITLKAHAERTHAHA